MSSQEQTSIKVEYVSPEILSAATYNPKKWDKVAKDKLTESIKRFGFVDPIIVNGAAERKNIVIGGHFRLEIAKELGMSEVPVVYVNIPDLEKEKELNLRLHRNTGELDYELLKEFDLSLLLDVGFDDHDLAQVWGDFASVEDEEKTEEDKETVEPSEIKPGDMFMLGDHRIICGDSKDTNVVARLMGEDQADVVYCDPPYNIGLNYSNGISTDGKYAGEVDDSLSDIEYNEFIDAILKNALSVAKPDAHVFFWCDQRYIWLFQGIFGRYGLVNKRVCLWIKNNFNMTPQVAFNKAYESCVYGTRGKPYLNDTVQNLHEIMNKHVDAGNRTIDDIVDLFDIWLAKRDPAGEYDHPTQKPLSLHEKPFKRCTKPGDIVLDLFGGSGSTLHAAEQMKRRARLCEVSPEFCSVIVRKFEAMTGKKAVKVE